MLRAGSVGRGRDGSGKGVKGVVKMALMVALGVDV